MKESRICQNCKQTFIIEPEDFVFYEKMQAPPPTLCPDCRMIRKLLWRNERTLYKRECGLCKQSILAMYHPRYMSPVYCNPCYHSDKWSAKEYAMNYDLNRDFMSQFKELLDKTPKAALHMGTQAPSVNTEYQNFAGENKNCYLIFNSAKNEDCAYVRGLVNCKNLCDTYFAEQAEYGYENVNIVRSSKVAWSENIADSLNSYFCRDCVSVQNCFGCINLRHKSYCLWNEELRKEEWEKRVNDLLGSYAKLEQAKRDFAVFAKRFPRRESMMLKSQNCTGNYLYESKNCKNCFEAFGCEDCKFGLAIKYAKDCYDLVGRGFQADLMLETVASGSNCSRILGTWTCETSHDIEYCFDMRACHNCIGCVGLKHGSHSILNKEYSEDEYKRLREKIVTELKEKNLYGLFLPSELSPWAYNETIAAELYPKSKEEILQSHFRFEEEIPRTKGKETRLPHEVPDNIKEVWDELISEILVCNDCGYNFRLIKSELELLKTLNLAIPRKCINCRYADRIHRRGSFNLQDRSCSKCNKEIKTTYTMESAPVVYCESCYQAEVV